MQSNNFQDTFVSYRSNTLELNDTTGGSWSNSYGSYGSLLDTFHSCYPNYTYHWHHDNPSTTEQAFKIVGKLIEKKVIDKKLTVVQFIELVNDVAKVL